MAAPSKPRKRTTARKTTEPKPEPANLTPTPVAAWKSKTQPYPLELPSKNVCLVKPVGPEAFLTSGTIPNMLQPLVEEAIRSGKGLPPDKAAELVADPSMLPQMMEMVDQLVCFAVVEPQIQMPPPPGLRDDSTLYIDEVNMEDKWFIFNHAVGGTRDLERFRREYQESVAAVDSGEAVEDETE